MRCEWANSSKEMQAYHDNEWGKISHDENYFFEMLILEGAQAGLSWATIIKRRQNYQQAYENFDVDKVAAFDQIKKDTLLKDSGIIRNHLKIDSSINNAKLIVAMHQKGEKFSDYIWSFTDGKVIDHHLKKDDEMLAQDELSQRISKDLKKRGFRFVGPTIIYSYLQAVGVINDHLDQCDFK